MLKVLKYEENLVTGAGGSFIQKEDLVSVRACVRANKSKFTKVDACTLLRQGFVVPSAVQWHWLTFCLLLVSQRVLILAVTHILYLIHHYNTYTLNHKIRFHMHKRACFRKKKVEVKRGGGKSRMWVKLLRSERGIDRAKGKTLSECGILMGIRLEVK